MWTKNQVTAVKRRCDVRIYYSDGVTPAWRGLDLISKGVVYICGVNSPHFDLATGTMTNKRRPLVVADDTFTAADTNICTAIGHGLETGDGPVQLTTTGTLPAGLTAATDYWIIRLGDDTFSFAESLANAYAGTAVDITDAGTGTHTLSDTASTQRGLDGEFTYQATQAETNHDAPMTTVLVEGVLDDESGTPDAGGATRAFTHVYMAPEDSTGWSVADIDGHTRVQALRILFRGEAAPYTRDPNTGKIVHRDYADTKDSHEGTITSTGRSDVDVIDPD